MHSNKGILNDFELFQTCDMYICNYFVTVIFLHDLYIKIFVLNLITFRNLLTTPALSIEFNSEFKMQQLDNNQDVVNFLNHTSLSCSNPIVSCRVCKLFYHTLSLSGLSCINFLFSIFPIYSLYKKV